MAKKGNKYKGIDFEEELNQGPVCYNNDVGEWWNTQAVNDSHQKAYKKIVNQIRKFHKKEPKIIVDFACGPGHLLVRLCKKFPNSHIIGIDGSAKMLEMCEEKLNPLSNEALARVCLVESTLPNFELNDSVLEGFLPAGWKADLVLFAFPNICPDPDEQPYYDKHGAKNRKDVAVAKRLGKAREPDPEVETVHDDAETMTTWLLDRKVISRNIRKLMKRGGFCVRAEYGNVKRKELTKLVQTRFAFEEGCMGKEFQGKKAEKIFKLQKSDYFNSGVIEDVYHQTKEKSDKDGGFFLNYLKAI